MENCDLFSDAGMAAQTARHVRMLQELAELAMTMARQVAARPVAPADPADEKTGGADPGLVLTRLARCVRQTVALEARLAADYRGWMAKSAAERAVVAAKQAERAEQAEARRRERNKNKAERAVGEVIQHAARPVDHNDLRREVKEWLWDSDDDADFAGRSVGEIVARICDDLYIPFDVSIWETTIWAREEMRTKPPGSPFANHVPEPDEFDPPDSRADDPPDSDPRDFAVDDSPAPPPAPRAAARGSDPP
jgi:hypothetical protein